MGSGMTIDLSPTALYAESGGSADMSIVMPDPQDVEREEVSRGLAGGYRGFPVSKPGAPFLHS